MAVGSPFLRSLDLERHGLEWCWPEVDLAHPLDDGSAGVMLRSLDETAAGLGRGRARAGGGCSARPAQAFDELSEDLAAAGPPPAAAPAAARALRAAGGCCRRRVLARALRDAAGAGAVRRRGGARVQPARPADELVGRDGADLAPATRSAGRSRAAARARSPTRWPPSCASTAARSRPACAVGSLGELPDADAVVLDLAPAAVADIAGDRLPGRVARAYRRYRHGPGAFKVDLAVEGGVPWTNEACRRAGTVHVVGSFEEIVAAERDDQPRPDARAAVRARRPAVPRRPGALGRRRPPGLGLRPRARTATTATRPRR